MNPSSLPAGSSPDDRWRSSKSQHAQSAYLKGAPLLKTIGIPSARPTVDIDMLRKGKADHDEETTKEVSNNRTMKLNRRISVAPMMDWTDGR